MESKMVRCPKCGRESTRLIGGGIWCDSCYETSSPVEPAQPELPRELPLFQFVEAGGYVEEYLRGVGEDQKIYDQALKRIAELEAEIEVRDTRIADLELTKKEALLSIRRLTVAVNEYEDKTDAEIASLKEQLAVFTKDIPKGEYCGRCFHRINNHCGVLDAEVIYSYGAGRYFKAPGCPVPAKEEQ